MIASVRPELTIERVPQGFCRLAGALEPASSDYRRLFGYGCDEPLGFRVLGFSRFQFETNSGRSGRRNC